MLIRKSVQIDRSLENMGRKQLWFFLVLNDGQLALCSPRISPDYFVVIKQRIVNKFKNIIFIIREEFPSSILVKSFAQVRRIVFENSHLFRSVFFLNFKGTFDLLKDILQYQKVLVNNLINLIICKRNYPFKSLLDLFPSLLGAIFGSRGRTLFISLFFKLGYQLQNSSSVDQLILTKLIISLGFNRSSFLKPFFQIL